MPNALGLYQLNRPDAVERSTLAHLPTPHPGAGLGTTALNAIQKLATAAGDAVPIPNGGNPANASTTDTTAWIIFAAGAALIVLAWTASLRTKPLRLTRGRTTST